MPVDFLIKRGRLKNGRFIKKTFATRIQNALKSMKKNSQKKTTVINDEQNNRVCDGLRIIDVNDIKNNLSCRQCKKLLDLKNMIKAKRVGFHSIFTISSSDCNVCTDVHTGIVKNNVSNINAGIILDKFMNYVLNFRSTYIIYFCAVHSGSGHTGLNKIMGSADIPSVSNDLYQRYENIVGQAIDKEAQDSCKRAALEERALLIENISKLCNELPPEIVKNIFPHLSDLQSSCPNNNPVLSPRLNVVDKCDEALEQIVSIIVSYDTGWSKRGNDRSYDSLNSYSAVIGFLSGKILDYTSRNRMCRKCQLGHAKDTHNCRLNFQGSAKAMEADAGVQLVHHSKILKEVRLQPRVIVGDEDSSMISAVKKDQPHISMHKLADKNNITKNFSNELYKLSEKHKELKKKGIIAHIKLCFSYAVSQNKGKSDSLTQELKRKPDHLYGRHENCNPSWCTSGRKHKVNFAIDEFYQELKNFFQKYAEKAHKFSVAASSQVNESFNNIVDHKLPKNKCLSTSPTSDYLVASRVCAKNDGEKSILNIRKHMGLLVRGYHSAKYAANADKKRLKRASKQKLQAYKIRRLELKQNRENLRKKREKTEGLTYQSNCGLEENTIQILPKDFEEVENNDFITVYFDLETTGLTADSYLLQIAAISSEQIFNIYIESSQKISPGATKATGLHHIGNDLYYQNKKLDTVSIKESLNLFQQF